MTTLRRTYAEQGYVLLRSFFGRQEVEEVRKDAKDVFLRQMRQSGIIDGNDPSDREFEAAMARLFQENAAAFMKPARCASTSSACIAFRLRNRSSGNCSISAWRRPSSVRGR